MIWTIVVVTVGAYAAVVGGMFALQRNLLYVPDTANTTPAASGAPELSVVTMETTDGLALNSWFRPATAAGRPTIVYFQGNAGHLGYRGMRMRPYLDAGFGVFMVGYRGYGGNPGRPTELGLYTDARAALAFLDARGVPAADVALYGESLGSAVAVHLARERADAGEPVAAVVLEAPLSSAMDVGAHHYPILPVRLLLKDRFDSATKIAGIQTPLLIVHGTRDRVVPRRFGEILFDAAAEPKEAVWIADAGHDDLDRFGIQHVVIRFLGDRVRQAL
ncbi:MAG: alpha/beta hydrolase [Rhodospirillales bacterium]|nr:alpha/beta hydrolase [Rhodospirillales bacterium]